MVRSEKLVLSCKLFVKAMEAIPSRRNVNSLAVPASLVSFQTLPVRIMCFVWNMYEDAALYEKYRHILRSRCSDNGRGWFNSMNMDTLCVLDYFAQDLTVKKSEIPRAGFESGLFAA